MSERREVTVRITVDRETMAAGVARLLGARRVDVEILRGRVTATEAQVHVRLSGPADDLRAAIRSYLERGLLAGSRGGESETSRPVRGMLPGTASAAAV